MNLTLKNLSKIFMKTNWQIKKISEISEISSGNSAPQKKDLFKDGVYPFFRTSDVGIVHLSDHLTHVRDYLNKNGIKGLKLFTKGTILFPKSGASTFLNHRVIMGCDGYVSSHLATITPNPNNVQSKYLYYFLTTVDAKEITSNSAYPSLKISDISKINVPLPPIDKQEEIIKSLDNKFDKLTKIKQLQEESISDTEKILSQKLHNIFEQGKIKNWKEEALGEICEIARGGSPRPIQHYLTNDVDAINWIKISDATDSTKYIYKTKQKITKEGLHKTRMVYPGDFILTNSMSFGRPYIMKTEGAIHDGWLLLRPKKELTEEYLYYFLSSDDIYSQFKKLAGGAVVQNLNSQLVKGVKILIPSLAEQKEIVKELDKLSEKIENLKQLQKSQLEDFKKIEKAYLKEAFNGESI